MNIDWKWLIVGMILGYVVIPRLHAAALARTAPKTAA